MKDLLKQLSGLLGTGFAASCCLRLPLALSALGATGLSFWAKDAYLFPFFVGFLVLTLWLLFRGLLIAATLWDFINGRKSTVCATDNCESDEKPVDMLRRAVNGAALSVAAAGAFYGMYKSALLKPSNLSSSISLAVNISMGRLHPCLRNLLHISRPSISSSIRSRTTKSYEFSTRSGLSSIARIYIRMSLSGCYYKIEFMR